MFSQLSPETSQMPVKNGALPPRNVRPANKDAVLSLIRQTSTHPAPDTGVTGISRAEIAQALDLSRSTVSAIVDELMDTGLVTEHGAGVSRGGRRPIVLQLNAEAGHVVGIDIGANHVQVVVANLLGRSLAEMSHDLNIAQDPQQHLLTVYQLVDECLARAQCSLDSVKAIGVGVPGPVIVAKGIVSAPPIMPGWDGFAIRQHLENHWHKPITLDNDADLGALGEWTYGTGQGESNLVYIKIGTGIGCGILLDGQIYHGVLGTAGEIGHVTITEDGPPCTCGNYGCLEAMAGGRAIAQRAQLAIHAGQRTALSERNHSRNLTARDVAEAAQAGDGVSQQLLNDAGRHIGSALASLINLLNPGKVLIGGGVTGAGDFLLNPIRQAVHERTMRASLRVVQIELSGLGHRATALGAVALALTTTFQHYSDAKSLGSVRP